MQRSSIPFPGHATRRLPINIGFCLSSPCHQLWSPVVTLFIEAGFFFSNECRINLQPYRPGKPPSPFASVLLSDSDVLALPHSHPTVCCRPPACGKDSGAVRQTAFVDLVLFAAAASVASFAGRNPNIACAPTHVHSFHAAVQQPARQNEAVSAGLLALGVLRL